MTEKLANKPNSSRKPKARPRRAHSRRNLQGALTSSTCKRAKCDQLADWLRAERKLATADETGARTGRRQAIDKWSSS